MIEIQWFWLQITMINITTNLL